MTEDYEGSDYDMSVVDLTEVAFMVIVEEDGDAVIKGKATPEYIVESLRALADSIEKEGMTDE